MSRKLLAIVLLLSFVFLTGIVAINVIDANRRAAAADKELRYEEETRPLRTEKAELISKLVSVEKEVVGYAARYRANLSMIFLGVSSLLYDELYPIMCNEELGVNLTGVICLSLEELPGLDGRITVAEYEELVFEKGWDTALYWQGCDFKIDENGKVIDTAAELRGYLDEMKALLAERGINFPKTLVFKDNNTYDSVKMDPVLAEYGISYAVHNCEGKLSLIEQDVTDEKGVLRPGAIGWQVQMLNGYVYGKNIFVEDLINRGGCAAFTVSFFPKTNSSYSQLHHYGGTSEERISFTKMVNYICGRVTDGNVTVCGIKDGFDNRLKYIGRLTEVSDEIAQRKKEIEQQMADIDEKIKDIADKYYHM